MIWQRAESLNFTSLAFFCHPRTRKSLDFQLTFLVHPPFVDVCTCLHCSHAWRPIFSGVYTLSSKVTASCPEGHTWVAEELDVFGWAIKVPIGGMSNRRGLNVVIIDTSMGQVLSAKTYDSWAYAWVHRLTGHSPVQLTDLTVFPALRNCWGDSDLALRQWHSQQRTVRHTIYLCDSHASFFFFCKSRQHMDKPSKQS